jgi:hypothetical protein
VPGPPPGPGTPVLETTEPEEAAPCSDMVGVTAVVLLAHPPTVRDGAGAGGGGGARATQPARPRPSHPQYSQGRQCAFNLQLKGIFHGTIASV